MSGNLQKMLSELREKYPNVTINSQTHVHNDTTVIRVSMPLYIAVDMMPNPTEVEYIRQKLEPVVDVFQQAGKAFTRDS